MNDKNLTNLQKLAFNQALHQTGSIDVAEDISSQTIYTYLLKHDLIDRQNIEGWITNTCKNYCNKHFASFKREKELQKGIRANLAEELEQRISESTNLIETEKDKLSFAFKEAKETLTVEELQTFTLYLQCNRNIKGMAKFTDESYAGLKMRISRILRKLKAETYKKMGMIATKKIVTPQLNDIIMKFLKRFKQHLEDNSLDKMYRYFSKKDLENYNPCFHIVKVLDYEIILKDSIYRVDIVFKNNAGKTDSFYFSFYIEKNHLKIITPPTPPKAYTVIKLDSPEGKKVLELLKKYPESKKGFHDISDEGLKIIDKIVEKHKRVHYKNPRNSPR